MKSFAQRIGDYREEMASFLKELVSIPTENPPGNCYGECLKLLEDKVGDLGLEPQRHGDCLLSFWGHGDRTVYFHGHYDVVPHSIEGQFQPRVEGGNLFGRGSSDMKSGLVSMIYAVRALRGSGLKLNGRVGLVMVPDEETAGPRGSRSLTSLLGADGMAMFTPEPTGGVIWSGSRGAITLKVTVRGKSAHVALQKQGVNAFEGMMAAAQKLGELKREVEARGSILMMGGLCGGGTSFNSVPAECWFTVERRINSDEDFETEKRRMLDLLKDTEVEVLQEGYASGTPEDHPAARALAECVEEVTGKRPEFQICPGLLETRFYAQRGVPAFAYGPGLLTVSHGPNEFVPLANVAACAVVYALAAFRLLE